MGWIQIRIRIPELKKYKAVSGSGIIHSGSATILDSIVIPDRNFFLDSDLFVTDPDPAKMKEQLNN